MVHETAAAFLLDGKYSLWSGQYARFALGREAVHEDMANCCLGVLTSFNDCPEKPKASRYDKVDPRGASEIAYWEARHHTNQPARQGGNPAEVVDEFFTRFHDIFSKQIGRAFLPYAANAWMYHLNRGKMDDRICDMLRRFFSSQICTTRWLMLLTDYPEEDLFSVKDNLAEAGLATHPWWNTLFHVTAKRAPRIHRNWHRKLRGSILHTAALYDLTEVVAFCLRRGYEPNLRDEWNTRPLHFAAVGDAAESARILLIAGADPNARNGVRERGGVPLEWNLRRGGNGPWLPDSFTVSKILLQYGANPNAIAHTRESPWRAVRALPQDEPHVQEILVMLKAHGMVPHEGWKMPIEEAARNADPAKVKSSVKEGQVVNMLCDRGATRLGRTIFEAPLHAALNSAARSREMVKLLLDNGADPRLPQADGRTPLHLATRYDDGLTDLFCDLGVDVNPQAEDGCTPMHDLLRVHDDGASRPIRSLIKRAARLDIRDFFGKTADDLNRERYGDMAKDENLATGARRHPLHEGDIFQCYAALETRFDFKAPRHLVLRILDLASYWIRTADSKQEMNRVDQHTPARERVYLRSQPLRIRHSWELRELRFTVTSCDQGWTVHGCAQGSYEQASSWCDVFGARESGEQIDFAGEDHPHYLFDNIHGDGRPSPENRSSHIPRLRQRVIVFGRDPPRRKSLVGLPPFEFHRSPRWLDEVRKGDAFWIRQGVKGKDWLCIVSAAAIEVFTSPLVPEVRNMVWKEKERRVGVA